MKKINKIVIILIPIILIVYVIIWPKHNGSDCAWKRWYDEDHCLMMQAVKNKNIKLCDRINDNAHNSILEDCYSLIINEIREYDACDQITDWKRTFYENKQDCLEEVAIFRGDCNYDFANKKSTLECNRQRIKNILFFAERDKCEDLDNYIGWGQWGQLWETCKKYKQWTIWINDLCKELKDSDMYMSCLSGKSDNLIFLPE